MALKIKKRRGRAARPQSEQQIYMMTAAYDGEPCNCPICEELGIDLAALGDGLDVRPITAEQAARLELLMKGVEEGGACPES